MSKFGLFSGGCCWVRSKGGTGCLGALGGKYFLLVQPAGSASGLIIWTLNLLGTCTLHVFDQYFLPSSLGLVRHSTSSTSSFSYNLRSPSIESATLRSTSLTMSSVESGCVFPTTISKGAA